MSELLLCVLGDDGNLRRVVSVDVVGFSRLVQHNELGLQSKRTCNTNALPAAAVQFVRK